MGKKTYCCYIDLKKAYDTVWRIGLWHRLWKKGIRGKMWKTLKNFYRETWTRIKINGKMTKEFKTDKGVKQGGVLSPILFSIYINKLIEKLRETGGKKNWEEAEKLQRKIARYILKAKQNVNNNFIEGELVWMTLKNRRIMLRLRFWRKILRMKKERLPKKIYRKEIEENRKNSWTTETKEILKTIGLQECWESQYTEETEEKWNKKIKTALENMENKKWET